MRNGFLLSALLIACSGCKTVSLKNGVAMHQGRFETVREQCQAALTKSQQALDAILAVSGDRNEANTLEPFNDLFIDLDNAASTAGLMANVHPDKQIRDESEACEQDISRFKTDLSLNRKLYDALVAIELKSLDPLAKRMAEKTLRDFKRSGVDKDDATRTQIKKLEEELVAIGQDFGRNIREDVRFIEVEPASLKGLPEDYIAAHKAQDNGKIRITTDYPDYIPFMMYSEDATARRALWMTFLQRAYPKNDTVLKQMIEKRHELAKLLGYPSFAAYVVEDKMIKTQGRVAEFVEQIASIAKEASAKEYAVLLAEKRVNDPNAKEVFGFERAYLEEKIKAKKYRFDSQAVRPYFEYNRVRDGLLGLTGELFGLSFERVNTETWHSSVLAYDVYEKDRQLGRIYLDLHPRDNKYKHAAQFTLKSGVTDKQMPEGVLVCNFPDTLMDHDQVVTFFHEFGHLLHHILGGHQKWIRFSGVATEWDFVETPSQFFEEWAWDEKVLARFAKHQKTNEVIPADLVKRMRDANEFGKALDARQQMFYAAMSLQYFSLEPKSFEPSALMRSLQAKYSAFPYVEGTHFNLNFGHLDGYSAMYYTYMWSKVIAKDLLGQFKAKGMLNTAESMKYRKTVLDQGGAKDADELVKDFLGRPYEFKAFRDWLLNG